jgi:hypothetical protein
MEVVEIPGSGRNLRPQAVVLLNPASGQPVVPSVVDSTGSCVNPDSWSHVYGYDASNQMITDTGTDGVGIWVKTFSYTAGNLTGETKWVRQ